MVEICTHEFLYDRTNDVVYCKLCNKVWNNVNKLTEFIGEPLKYEYTGTPITITLNINTKGE
jgi:hypothetical protein